ncbi:uncharacterized protein LOC105842971 [Bombyx mori]|uniref:DDE-1 domain-containing protein n=1 Tax=Bombyx mori TaxID=7091 RepID=A0A8R2GCN4_BOMMO|nr:uncharacterized protein LOC105842971 [Bombyx mori]
MPRNYKPNPRGKQYRKYDDATIKQALEVYNTTPNCSISVIAKQYNINKSVLYRHNRKTMKKQGGQTALDDDTEHHIVQYLNVCSDWGYPLDTYDLRIMVKLYLDNMGITHNRFKDNMPGPDYATRFLKRHKDSISLRLCQNIKKSRARVSPDTIEEYFGELEETLKEIDPNNIVNYDETNLSDDPGRKKVIVKRGTKYPERVLNQSKSSISIMMAGTAAGVLLPPYVIYKASNVYDSWTTGGPKGTRYHRTASGWIDGNTFEDYIKCIIIPFFKDKPGRKILIGDNLSSHLSIEVIKICEENHISFVFLPANSTHLTQPLDIAFFRPMKMAWRNILLRWKKTDGRSQATVPKGCFPRLLKLLINELSENVDSNLKAGFRKAGIIPIDRNEVLSRLPKENTEDPEKSRYAVDKSVLDILKEMRYGTINIKEPAHKSKINVDSGKSLGNIDEENFETESENETTSKRPKTRKQGNKKKKIKVIPGKAVDLNSEDNKTENEERNIANTENVIKKYKKKVVRAPKCKINSKKKEVKTLIDKLKTDLMKKEMETNTGTPKYNETKKIDVSVLPMVCVDECIIASCSENTNNTCNDLNHKKNYEEVIDNNCNSYKESFHQENNFEDYWGNGSQQKDDELFVNTYFDKDVANEDYVPDIVTENIFHELIDPLKDGVCVNYNSYAAEATAENNNSKDKKIAIISVENVDSDSRPVTLNKCKKISLNSIVSVKKDNSQNSKNIKQVKSKLRRRSYYKNEADILRDLIDDNIQ